MVQRDLAVTDPPEPGEAPGPHGVRLGLSCSIVEFGERVGGRADRRLDRVQSLGVDQHRQLAVEACRPCRKASRIARRRLQLRHRICRRSHVTGGEQRLAARDQELGGQVFAVGQLVVDLFQRVQRPVVEVGGVLVGEASHRWSAARRQYSTALAALPAHAHSK